MAPRRCFCIYRTYRLCYSPDAHPLSTYWGMDYNPPRAESRRDKTMSEQKKLGPGTWVLTIGISLIVLSIALGAWEILLWRSLNSNPQDAALAESTPAMDREGLDLEKLRQEIKQLQIENDKSVSPWQSVPIYATLVTAVVAVGGLFLTVAKQFSERDRDRQQREAESIRHVDEKFTSVVSDLGSDSESLRMSAIVSLITFLGPDYARFHEQVYLLLLANLKLKSSTPVNRLLIQAFEKALAFNLKAPRTREHPLELDFTNANLYHANLSYLDLSNADLGFADLRLANLTYAVLFRAKGIEANFERAKLSHANFGEARLAKANLAGAHLHQTNLVAANLKETDLTGAEFLRARLQSAHLEGATIDNARFEQAYLQDAYFVGARLSPATIRSIAKAFNWEDAHFDEDVRAKIAEIARKSENHT